MDPRHYTYDSEYGFGEKLSETLAGIGFPYTPGLVGYGGAVVTAGSLAVNADRRISDYLRVINNAPVSCSVPFRDPATGTTSTKTLLGTLEGLDSPVPTVGLSPASLRVAGGSLFFLGNLRIDQFVRFTEEYNIRSGVFGNSVAHPLDSAQLRIELSTGRFVAIAVLGGFYRSDVDMAFFDDAGYRISCSGQTVRPVNPFLPALPKA
jgi:hypothetical protein